MANTLSEKQNRAQEFQQSLMKILDDNPKHTEFQKQSMSERLEMLRQLGYKQDKLLADEAFWAADRQRIDEKVQR